ncbi:MAG: hypothetical protein QNK37_10475 [Acidobacteriota bacterium]|nr:hypothetical protein [Acidobacteriota bacterium]
MSDNIQPFPKAKKKPLNTNIPEDLFVDLEQYCNGSGYSKTQVVIAALHQFLAIKREEQRQKRKHPGKRITAQVVLEAQSQAEEEEKIASVLIY